MVICLASKYGFITQEPHAKAMLRDIDASAKDLCEVCGNIRNLPAELAIQFLEQAKLGNVAIRYKKHNKHLGHRKELGSRKGRYPVKACKFVLKVLKNAYANAQQMGLTMPVVAYVSASKMRVYPRMAAKGRRVRADYETAYVQIALMSGPEPEVAVKKPAKKKPKENEGKIEEKK